MNEETSSIPLQSYFLALMFQLVFKDTPNKTTDFEILVAWKSVNVDLTLTGVESNTSLATPSFLRNLHRIRIGIFLRLPSTKSHLCVFHRPDSLAFLHYNCSWDPRHVHTECKLPVIWLSLCTQARTTANQEQTRGSPFPTDFFMLQATISLHSLRPLFPERFMSQVIRMTQLAL